MTRKGRNRLISCILVLLFASSFFLEADRSTVHREQFLSAATVSQPVLAGNNSGMETTAIDLNELLWQSTTTDLLPLPLPTPPTPVTVHRQYDGTIAIEGAILRSGPGLVYDQAAILPVVTAVTITGRKDDWLEVVTVGGETGWIDLDIVILNPQFNLTAVPEKTDTLLPPTSVLLHRFDAVTRHAAHVRIEPSLEASVSSLNIPANTPVSLIARDDVGLWVAIEDGQGFAGWILSSSLQFTPGFQIARLPVTDFTAPPEPAIMAAVTTAIPFGWGAQTHNIRENGNRTVELGMTWTKVQYKWHSHSRAVDVVDLIEQAHQRNLKILLAIPGQEYPTHIEYVSYVEFLRSVAALDPAPDAIEVWNEMNIDFEWPVGQIDPAVYVSHMLAPAYQAIKSMNPNILVISGAPAPTGFHDGIHAWADDRYIMGMAEAGAAQYLDCVGVHYNAGATSPTAVSGHPAGDFYGWYYLPSLRVYYEAFGRQKPLCITELGYLTIDGLNQRLPDRFWWARNTTLAKQTDWLAEAITLAYNSRFVSLVIIFNLDIYHYDQNDPQAGYAIIRPDKSCPACTRFPIIR